MLRSHRVLLVLGLFVAGCGGTAPPVEEPVAEPAPEPAPIADPFAEDAPPAEPEGPSDEELIELASSAYIYGYPLVYNVDEMIRLSGSEGMVGAAPVNVVGASRAPAGPSDEFVSINNDSLYAMSAVDLREGPLVLHVPATRGRYYVLQFIDAWTNNFAYVGKRSTGADEQWYFLVPPGWEGEIPEGPTVIRAPTPIFTIVGRFATTGSSSDVRAVRRLQSQTYLAPLGEHRRPPSTADREFGDHVLAAAPEGVDESLAFWEKLRLYMQLAPPPAHESELVATFAEFGISDASSPYVTPDAHLREILIAGAERGKGKLEAAMASGANLSASGWSSALHAFDYNVDYFEVGTIDAPEWKIEDPATRFFTRALAARVGLWGNHGYEAAYSMTFVDGDGQPLSSENSYEITFSAAPPVDAFWSLTMYNLPNFYLAENSIDRYSIGDRTPGLRRNRDGSFTIYISRERPADRRQRSNWLPSPEGPFRPILRMYLPRAEILDGSYEIPAIRRVGGEQEAAAAAPEAAPESASAAATEAAPAATEAAPAATE